MKCVITEEQINKILAYLSRLPFADVYQLVNMLQSHLEILDDSDKVKEPPKKP